MELQPLYLAALQSSFILGLIHGVNPCGHSWLVIAPFVAGEKNGKRVFSLTSAFLFGTAVACLVLGATLGSISMLFPPSAAYWMELSTSLILILIGLILLYDPHILHSHDHDHDHDHAHEHHDHAGHHHKHHPCEHKHHHSHGPTCGHAANGNKQTRKKWMAASLFSIGFVNMIIPCPTAAVMYGYALNSGSAFTATLVFGTYALSTALSVGLVIYCIFRITTMAGTLQKDWLEPLIMRSAGVIIICFSGYSLYSSLAT
ncbi:sulfite exporter TauE/SafE family protein [Desulfosediminicola ganghwensis]|uniref:HoxN/HupN/NixA family nickel/cobalt transporter n=1 Tax=Desulfosediminicola ganghwensis TaxID=2569540 RepID=UPI0010ACF3CD|nr:sulfite exporter TauE/SafE family protein [Desulfosediminicola ganghwensis]